MATSITIEGITYNFTPAHTVGYWDADGTSRPYLQGDGISITSIDFTPTAYLSLGGSMVNPMPGGSQGFAPGFHNEDGHIYQYLESKDASLSFPITVNAGDSIVTAIQNSNPSGNHQIDRIVGLHVRASAASAGDFEPTYYGTDHSVTRNISSIDYTKLRNFTATASTASQADMEQEWRQPKSPWWEWGGFDYGCTAIRPYRNWPATYGGGLEAYGVAASANYGAWMQWLNVRHDADNTANNLIKKNTVTYIIQCAVHMEGYFNNGGGPFYIGNTHQTGFGFPMYFAAHVMNDADFESHCLPTNFAELEYQTGYVEAGQVDFPVDYELSHPGDTTVRYIEADIGLPEWSPHKVDWYKGNRDWAKPTYRGSWSNVVGFFLGYRYMGMEDLVNWPAAFAYMERVIAIDGLSGVYEELYDQEYAALVPLAPQPPILDTTASLVRSGRAITIIRQGTNLEGLTIHHTINGGATVDGVEGEDVAVTITANTVLVAWCSSNIEEQADSSSLTASFTIALDGKPVPPTLFAP